MKNKKPQPIIKLIPLPTKTEMKRFAKHFTQQQWDACCEFPEFIELVTTNLEEAQNVAIRILNGIYE